MPCPIMVAIIDHRGGSLVPRSASKDAIVDVPVWRVWYSSDRACICFCGSAMVKKCRRNEKRKGCEGKS